MTFDDQSESEGARVSRRAAAAGVCVEVWPLMASHDGLWLISGLDAWHTGAIDSKPHTAVQRLLTVHGVNHLVQLLHSTSWRPVEDAVMLTYIAALDHHDVHIPTRWPASLAITPEWAVAVGHPLPHPPTAAPAPRDVDVLLHGLRHLSFLAATDTSAHACLDESWAMVMEPLGATLAGLYQSAERSACG